MSLSLPPLLPGGMPLLSHLHAFYRDRMQVLCRGYATCGPMFRLRLAPQSMAVLVEPGRNTPSLYAVNGRPVYVHLNGLAIVRLK